MKHQVFGLIFLGLSTCLAAAQAPTDPPASTPPPLPSGPLLARAPDFFRWQVTCMDTSLPLPLPGQSADAKTRKPSKLVTILTKTGKVLQVQSIDQDGQQVSRWCFGGSVYVQKPGMSVPLRLDGPDRDGDYVSFAGSDFPECSWISAKSYTGQQKAQGHQCLVFGGDIPNLDDFTAGDLVRAGEADPLKNANTVAAAAYIDLDTRLPVGVRKGTLVYTYQILDAPTEMQTLPASIEKLIRTEQQRQNDLIRRPPDS